MIVSDRKSPDGVPLVIHNVGSGTQEENRLFSYEITGHHRLISCAETNYVDTAALDGNRGYSYPRGLGLVSNVAF